MSKEKPSARRQSMLYALEEHARGHIAKHVANIDLMLDRPVGVAGHADILSTIMDEIDEVAYYEDQLSIIATHLKPR